MIRKGQTQQTIVVNLDGPDGNKYALIELARRLCKLKSYRVDIDPEAMEAELRDGDMIHLITTFDKYFGKFVALETDKIEDLEAFGVTA